MSEPLEGELVEHEVTDVTTLMQLNKSEYDMQIATAKKYPRSVKQFINDATSLATLNEEVASECMYALKRSGKTIEGPSARFAEIVLHAWGNARAAARVIDEDDRFVTAQGVFMDLQKNVAISMEVPRRITTRDGEKYGDDMIGVTSNAACSIAIRNAILKGIPKAFWKLIYESARATAIGNAETLHDRRLKMMGYFQKMGVTEAQIFELLEVKGVEEIGLEHMALLKGVATAIKDGDTTVDQAFQVERTGKKVGESALNEQVGSGKKAAEKKKEPAKTETPKTETKTETKSDETAAAETKQETPKEARKQGPVGESMDMLASAISVKDVKHVDDYFLGPEAKGPKLSDDEAQAISEAVRERRAQIEAKASKPKGGGQQSLV